MSQDLNRLLEALNMNQVSDLENALGVKFKHEKPAGYGICAFLNEEQAISACRQFRTIPGVTARQKSGRVIVQPEELREPIDRLAMQQGWIVDWYTVVEKS